MAVLVLGAGGFVGGFILRFLRNNGHEVYSLSRGTSSNEKNRTFPVGLEGDFEIGELLEFFSEHEVQHVVHCANKFSRNPGFAEAHQMLLVNFLLPARVLRVAIEAGALSFVNLGSAWQVTDGRLGDAPDYVSSKESFRQHLALNSDRIQARTLLLNEVFGAKDPREKLINQAFRCAINNQQLEIRSEMTELGLVFLPRLAAEISALVSGGLARPSSYIYENYSLISIKDLLSEIGSLVGAGQFWRSLGLAAEPSVTGSLPKIGQCDRELMVSDLASLVPDRPDKTELAPWSPGFSN